MNPSIAFTRPDADRDTPDLATVLHLLEQLGNAPYKSVEAARLFAQLHHAAKFSTAMEGLVLDGQVYDVPAGTVELLRRAS